MKNYYRLILGILLGILSITSFAWNNSIEFGYGISHDPNHSKYNNSGVLLNGDFLPIYRGHSMLWSLNAALGQWYTTSPTNKYLTTAAVSVALRYYMDIDVNYPAYLLASIGPAYLSSRKFGENEQGSNLAFQTNGGIGMEFDNIDVNLRFAHFSNAYLAKPNDGFNVLYLLSVGYLF